MKEVWLVSSSSDKDALNIVDGLGPFSQFSPHYSRRTPGSKTFTGVGQEIVLISHDKTAVWAVIRQKTPMAKGTGLSRGRNGNTDSKPKYVFRNMLFRNLGTNLSSFLIKFALAQTYLTWINKYGSLPSEKLRTEIDPKKIKSSNPGCCYKIAGFFNSRMVRKKIYLDAPCFDRVFNGDCNCCDDSKWSLSDSEEIKNRLL
jgi:hypothetical protein